MVLKLSDLARQLYISKILVIPKKMIVDDIIIIDDAEGDLVEISSDDDE